jgi:hypothetical protein
MLLFHIPNAFSLEATLPAIFYRLKVNIFGFKTTTGITGKFSKFAVKHPLL